MTDTGTSDGSATQAAMEGLVALIMRSLAPRRADPARPKPEDGGSYEAPNPRIPRGGVASTLRTMPVSRPVASGPHGLHVGAALRHGFPPSAPHNSLRPQAPGARARAPGRRLTRPLPDLRSHSEVWAHHARKRACCNQARRRLCAGSGYGMLCVDGVQHTSMIASCYHTI